MERDLAEGRPGGWEKESRQWNQGAPEMKRETADRTTQPSPATERCEWVCMQWQCALPRWDMQPGNADRRSWSRVDEYPDGGGKSVRGLVNQNRNCQAGTRRVVGVSILHPAGACLDFFFGSRGTRTRGPHCAAAAAVPDICSGAEAKRCRYKVLCTGVPLEGSLGMHSETRT